MRGDEGALRLLPVDDFPGVQEPSGTAISAESAAFAGCRQAARAASRDEARPVLTGVLLEISREGVVLVATDSYRLAVRDLVATADGEAKAIVPERALTEAGRAALDEKSPVQAFVNASQIAFKVGSLTLTSRLIEGEFPNYRQLLPETHESCPRSPANSSWRPCGASACSRETRRRCVSSSTRWA